VHATRDDLIDELLVASRALLGVAATSLAHTDDVTLPQFRALVLLGHRPSTTTTELADGLSVHQSTATRLCDRLVRKGWVRRQPVEGDRRQVALVLTPSGRRLVATVLRRRRQAIAAIVDGMTEAQVRSAAGALAAFATAAGEPAVLDL
jgi:DNA-binding MarR family transcriptional regulator